MFVSSPKLIADCYALHRLLAPRHPPYALDYLNTIMQTLESALRGAPSLDTASTTIPMQNVKDSNPARPGGRATTPPPEGGRGRPVFEKQAAIQSTSTFTSHRARPRRALRLHKGGDPAAGSPTATLLRLHPNHRPDRWRLPPKGLGERLRVRPTFVV